MEPVRTHRSEGDGLAGDRNDWTTARSSGRVRRGAPHDRADAPRPARAEEITQDAFLKLLQEWPKISRYERPRRGFGGRRPARDALDRARTALGAGPAGSCPVGPPPPSRFDVDGAIAACRLATGRDRAALLRGPAGGGSRDDPRLRRIHRAGPSPSWPQSAAATPGRGRRCRLTDASARNCSGTRRIEPDVERHLGAVEARPKTQGHRWGLVLVATAIVVAAVILRFPSICTGPGGGRGLPAPAASDEASLSLRLPRPLPRDRGDVHGNARRRESRGRSRRPRGPWTMRLEPTGRSSSRRRERSHRGERPVRRRLFAVPAIAFARTSSTTSTATRSGTTSGAVPREAYLHIGR